VLRGADRADVEVNASHIGWAVQPKVKHPGKGQRGLVAYRAFDKIGSGAKRNLP
jgi:hypothetical protein